MRVRTRVVTTAVLAIVAALAGAPAGAGPATSDPLVSHQWALDRVGAARGWEAGTGEGIVVAVVDTGVDLAHEDLAGRIVPGWDMVDGDDDPQDCHGHGTFVAGIVAAATDNGRGVASVAPGARIMPVRALECDGQGGPLEASIRWAADHGAHVINISVSELTQALIGPLFADAVEYAWSKGAIPVVAAGNQFVTGSGFADEPALVVSATDRRDRKPAYSSGVGAARWGLAAPGGAGSGGTAEQRLAEEIVSTWWSEAGERYGTNAGTSFSAPHVAGAAAILRGLGLTPQQTVDRLLATAVDIGAPGRDSTFGHGRLDIAAAVAGLGPAPPPAPATPSPAPPAPPAPAAPPPPPPPPAPPGPPPTAPAAPPAPDTTVPGDGDAADDDADDSDAGDAGAEGEALPEAVPIDPDEPGGGDRSRTGPALAATGLAAVSGAGWLWVRRRARAGPAGR